MRRIMGNLGLPLIVTATFTTILSAGLTSCGRNADSENGARLAADGVSFDPVPTDVNIDCNYHILQGTQRFRGTYFVIPKVNIARDREDKTAIKMLPGPPKQDFQKPSAMPTPVTSKNCAPRSTSITRTSSNPKTKSGRFRHCQSPTLKFASMASASQFCCLLKART